MQRINRIFLAFFDAHDHVAGERCATQVSPAYFYLDNAQLHQERTPVPPSLCNLCVWPSWEAANYVSE